MPIWRGAARHLTERIIGAAMEVHRGLGPGLLESAYVRCLMHELALRGISFRSEVPFPLVYKGLHLEYGYRADLLVEEQVLVEVKAVEALTPVHEAQVLTYLKLSGKDAGLLINFNVMLLKQGLRRLVSIGKRLTLRTRRCEGEPLRFERFPPRSPYPSLLSASPSLLR